MSINHKLQTFLGVALVAFLAVAPMASAQAADLKPGCYPTEQVQAFLKEEGQKPLVIADGMSAKGSKFASLFTTNADLSVGYYVEGNAPLSGKATTFCLRTKYTNVNLFDGNKPGVPHSTLINSDNKKAEQSCTENKLGSCGAHDSILINAEKNRGERVLLQASGVAYDAAGQEITGPLLTVLANPENNAGTVLRSYQKDGTAVVTADLENAKYTALAKEIIKALPVQTETIYSFDHSIQQPF